MKRIILMIMTAAILASCGASGKAGKPQRVYLPGYDMLRTPDPNVTRGWGMGTSKDRSLAQSIALTEAAGQIANNIETAVSSTAESYSTTSKKFFQSKTHLASKQSLNLSTIVFTKWEGPDKQGQWTCYIVRELSLKTFTTLLENTIKEDQNNTDVNFDAEVFNNIFMEKIHQASKQTLQP